VSVKLIVADAFASAEFVLKNGIKGVSVFKLPADGLYFSVSGSVGYFFRDTGRDFLIPSQKIDLTSPTVLDTALEQVDNLMSLHSENFDKKDCVIYREKRVKKTSARNILKDKDDKLKRMYELLSQRDNFCSWIKRDKESDLSIVIDKEGKAYYRKKVNEPKNYEVYKYLLDTTKLGVGYVDNRVGVLFLADKNPELINQEFKVIEKVDLREVARKMKRSKAPSLDMDMNLGLNVNVSGPRIRL
jgi:hypothetical protein